MITSRNYVYLLGGKDNYAADRAAIEAVLKVNPEMAFTARANRAWCTWTTTRSSSRTRALLIIGPDPRNWPRRRTAILPLTITA